VTRYAIPINPIFDKLVSQLTMCFFIGFGTDANVRSEMLGRYGLEVDHLPRRFLIGIALTFTASTNSA
jgi:hypothetical protein